MRVELNDVGHAFERGRFLFRHVTMQLPPGAMIALVGPSGSGKSTLLSIVAGWQVPTEGQVVRGDVARIAWVFQNPFGVPARTVLDHVSLPAVARGASRCEADRHAHGLLERFGLADQGRQSFATLSGGEAQRLMLARAVASEPDLILVDEPTAQLDATSAATVIEVLDGLAAHGASVIIATHDTRVRNACPDVLDLGSRAPDLDARLVEHPCPMKGREIGREAVRDILSGTAKATLLTCIFLALVGGLAIADARVLVNAMDEAARWRAGGGAIVIMNAPGRIDGAACAALRDTAGIRASGAIRPSPTSLSTPAMPSTAVTTWDVTPGFPAVVTTAPATPGETGLWLSEELAQDLNRYHGATLATTNGPAPVAGTFPMPEEDGRLPTLAYAILAPVPATGRFDACWAEVWPPDPIRSDLLRTTAHGADADASDSGLARLNPSLAADYDTAPAIRNRITRISPAVALLLAWILGLLASRIRRLEMASSLHAGLTPAPCSASTACRSRCG